MMAGPPMKNREFCGRPADEKLLISAGYKQMEFLMKGSSPGRRCRCGWVYWCGTLNHDKMLTHMKSCPKARELVTVSLLEEL